PFRHHWEDRVNSPEDAMQEREGMIDKQTEVRHLLRNVKTSLELAIVALAPSDLLNRLGRVAGLLEGVSQAPAGAGADPRPDRGRSRRGRRLGQMAPVAHAGRVAARTVLLAGDVPAGRPSGP